VTATAVSLSGVNSVGGSGIPYSPQRATFSISYNDHIFPYRTACVFLLPGENLRVDIADGHQSGAYEFRTSDGEAGQLTPYRWTWTAPEDPGIFPLTITRTEPPDTISLNAFVMVPYDSLRGGYLNGYRIGGYPRIPLMGLSLYEPPAGFIEVTPENEDVWLTPHFQLKQFLCKQDGEYPKYVVLREKLLLKLELILEKINEKGYRCSTFSVLSGYRTPYYNKAIGNVKYSRHLWGGAADIFIDENPRDDIMDDLNGDGKINWRDAEVLYAIIDELYGRPWYEPFIGGLAWYKKTPAHGPFVHVDVRGRRARWGD
jgi:hypothetical protein